MGEDVVLVIAHGDAVGRGTYLAFVELLKVVVCKFIERSGHAIVLLLYDARVDLLEAFYELPLGVFKTVGRYGYLLQVDLTANFKVVLMFSARSFAYMSRNTFCSELFSECSRHTVNLLGEAFIRAHKIKSSQIQKRQAFLPGVYC